MDNESRIFVAGHKGLVGSAIVRNLKAKGYTNIITVDREPFLYHQYRSKKVHIAI